MRPVTFQRQYVKHPAGSCLVSFGETRVLCTASIERDLPPHRRGSGGGWLGAEYSMLPGSTSPRKRRDTTKPDGRSVEIQRLVGRSLRAAVDLDALGEVSIQIDCDVLQADGGTRTAAITGGFVALYDALTVLAAKNGVAAGPSKYLVGQVAAVSVGMVAGELVVDLDYERDSKAEVDMNVVMRLPSGGSAAFIEVQGTGEHGVFDRTALDRMLDGAQGAIAELFAAQRKALGVGA